MKQLLNTLFVQTQGAYLHREGDTVAVEVEKVTKLRVPIHTLGSIVCFGNVLVSPQLMGLCSDRRVHFAFHSENGKFLARVHGRVTGNVLLRRKQYRGADDETFSAGVARAVVAGKIANARQVILRARRDHGERMDVAPLDAAEAHLARLIGGLKGETPLDTVRGIEGDAGRVYFGVFDHLLTNQKETFAFRERSRRPPLDPINALLSFIYALLANDVASACESVGLDPQVGFLHRDRSGRPSLALDLMEEFRPWFADRLALSLVNREQVKGKGFRKSESGAVVMDDATRKEVLVAYQNRKKEFVFHPFIEEKVEIGLIPFVQALLLARYLRGDLDGYPPFVWR